MTEPTERESFVKAAERCLDSAECCINLRSGDYYCPFGPSDSCTALARDYLALATPTPVSDDAVREALERLRTQDRFLPTYLTDLATLEAAVHQRDERIDLLQAIREAQGSMIRRLDPKLHKDDYPVLPQDAHQADPLLEAVEQADRMLADEKKKQAAE